MLAQLDLMQAACDHLPLNRSCIKCGFALRRLLCKLLGHHEQADGSLGLCMLAGRYFLCIEVCTMGVSSSPPSELPSPRSATSAATLASIFALRAVSLRQWYTAPQVALLSKSLT